MVAMCMFLCRFLQKVTEMKVRFAPSAQFSKLVMKITELWFEFLFVVCIFCKFCVGFCKKFYTGFHLSTVFIRFTTKYTVFWES